MSTTSLLPHMYNVSLENMRQQKDDFFIALTNTFQQYKDKAIKQEQLTKEIAKLTFDYTKITVKLTIQSGDANAFIEASQFDQAHVFWPGFYQEYEEFRKIMKRPLCGAKGWIDPVNGQVGGEFSTTVNPVTIMTGIMQWPADEIAAVYLHEVGHAYTFFFYLGQIAVSNIIITQAVREAVGTTDIAKRTVILKQATEYLDIENQIKAGDLATAPTINNATATETLLVNAFRERTKSATGTDLYDIRSCEQLADQFAVRWGSGASLARAIAKFEGMAPWQKGRGWYMFVTAVKVLSEISIAAATGGVSLVLSLLFCIANPGTAKQYDDNEYRARLIRQQMIDRIRNLDIPTADRAKLIADIESVMNLEKRIGKDTYGLAFRMAMMISSKRRAERDNQELQKALEDMIYNPLYLTQAKLQQMGAS